MISASTLSATTLTGTLNTAAQTAITSIGTLTNLTLNTGGTGLFTPNIKFWDGVSAWTNFDHTMYLGITQGSATTQKALVVNSTLNISGIRNFVCTGTSTLGTVNCGSITTSSTNTISTYGISVGSGGITGTLQTGSQTNITAVGTLDSLGITNGLSCGTVNANSAGSKFNTIDISCG
ncbi:hypothetical protein Pcac1_g8140 [Phytophthora cactorum]|nr:hypothetical protein Pcac1_g16804 [Phytophthora cactorum]KAG2782090.1 hypothetical protein Pcac1_g8140 [Phytophthora cactorum]KAG3149532.1 hypothetical protein PC128_g23394 [Phytophthora cactorum]